MELREIMLLFAPIAINGVFLFLFQQFLNRKFLKRSKFEETQYELFKKYIDKLEHLLITFKEEEDAYTYVKISAKTANDNGDLSKVQDTLEYKNFLNKLQKTNFEVVELITYCNRYSQVIYRDKNSRYKMEVFVKCFKEYGNYYHQLVTATITDTDMALLFKTKKRCENNMYDLMDCALAYLCGKKRINKGKSLRFKI